MNQNHFSFVQELTGGTGWALGELPVTGRKIVICSPSCCNLHLMELLQLAAYGPLLSLANPCTGLRSTTNRLTAHSWTSHTHPPTDSSSLMNITRVHSQHLKLLHSTSIFTSPAHTPHWQHTHTAHAYPYQQFTQFYTSSRLTKHTAQATPSFNSHQHIQLCSNITKPLLHTWTSHKLQCTHNADTAHMLPVPIFNAHN